MNRQLSDETKTFRKELTRGKHREALIDFAEISFVRGKGYGNYIFFALIHTIFIYCCAELGIYSTFAYLNSFSKTRKFIYIYAISLMSKNNISIDRLSCDETTTFCKELS